jgi:tellurite resistance protein
LRQRQRQQREIIMQNSVISPQTALLYIMFTVAAADSQISSTELQKVDSLIRVLPIFEGINENRLKASLQECLAILEEGDGLHAVFALACESLEPRLRETAYAMAVEVAAADLSAKQEELLLLQMLRDELGLDKLVAAAIERSARARYARL